MTTLTFVVTLTFEPNVPLKDYEEIKKCLYELLEWGHANGTISPEQDQYGLDGYTVHWKNLFPTPFPTYEPGDIVIVNCGDAQFGQVRVPGIVRYRHEGVEQTGAPEGYYAVALVIPAGPEQQYIADGIHSSKQWDLRPDEIEGKVGKVAVERPQKSESGRYLFLPDSDTRTIEQQGKHRSTTSSKVLIEVNGGVVSVETATLPIEVIVVDNDVEETERYYIHTPISDAAIEKLVAEE